MKLLLIALALLTLSLTCSAQGTDQSTIQRSLYYRGLVSMLASRAQDAKYANANDPLHKVIIERDINLSEGLPPRIGEVDIEYLDSIDLRDRYRKLKHAIPIFAIRPMVNEGDRLVVSFTRYWFRSTKRTNSYSLEGGYRVIFRFDCLEKDFIVESAKLWGI